MWDFKMKRENLTNKRFFNLLALKYVVQRIKREALS